MKTTKLIEKTQFVTIDNKQLLVNFLPSEIRAEIETLDAYRQELNDLMFEVEKSQILTQVKNAQVQEMLKEWANPQTQQDNQD